MKLYNYLSERELNEGKDKVTNLLLKVGKFNEKKEASVFVEQTLTNKEAGKDLSSLECEVITFLNRFKREKAPQYKALVNAKGILNQLSNHSKITI